MFVVFNDKSDLSGFKDACAYFDVRKRTELGIKAICVRVLLRKFQ